MAGENILLVDDDSVIVAVGQRMLKLFGYNVDGQTSSGAAWDLFRSDPDKYDLVITDQMMPEMLGTELIQKILSLRPKFPIIMVTGFAQGLDEEDLQRKGVRAVLLKPLAFQGFASTVRRVLDEINGHCPDDLS